MKKLYDFDDDLQQMLRGYLEIAETYCKTQIANTFALEKCMTSHERPLQSTCAAFREIFAQSPISQQLFSLCVSACAQMASANVRAEK